MKEWQRKGATLGDKTARLEFGLTQDEIYDAIDAGTLHYREASIHGNPWLRLLRRVWGSITLSRSLTCNVMAGPVAVMLPVRTRGSGRPRPSAAVSSPSSGR